MRDVVAIKNRTDVPDARLSAAILAQADKYASIFQAAIVRSLMTTFEVNARKGWIGRDTAAGLRYASHQVHAKMYQQHRLPNGDMLDLTVHRAASMAVSPFIMVNLHVYGAPSGPFGGSSMHVGARISFNLQNNAFVLVGNKTSVTAKGMYSVAMREALSRLSRPIPFPAGAQMRDLQPGQHKWTGYERVFLEKSVLGAKGLDAPLTAAQIKRRKRKLRGAPTRGQGQ